MPAETATENRGKRRQRALTGAAPQPVRAAVRPPPAPSLAALTKCSQHQCVSSQCREGGFGLETSMR